MAAHVPAGLHALGDHVAATGVDRRLGLVDGPDLPTADHVRRNSSRVGPFVEELDDRQPGCQQLDDVGLHEVGDASAANRGGREGGDFVEVPLDHRDLLPADADHSERTGVRDGSGQCRCRRAAHARLLQRQPASDELGEAVHAVLLR